MEGADIMVFVSSDFKTPMLSHIACTSWTSSGIIILLLASDLSRQRGQVQDKRTMCDRKIHFSPFTSLNLKTHSHVFSFYITNSSLPISQHIFVILYPPHVFLCDKYHHFGALKKGRDTPFPFPLATLFEFCINEIITFPCLINYYSATHKFGEFDGKNLPSTLDLTEWKPLYKWLLWFLLDEDTLRYVLLAH